MIKKGPKESSFLTETAQIRPTSLMDRWGMIKSIDLMAQEDGRM
jgi:hypothetical protein